MLNIALFWMVWMVNEGARLNREIRERRERGTEFWDGWDLLPQKNTIEHSKEDVGNFGPGLGVFKRVKTGISPVSHRFSSGLICWSDNVGHRFS
jgi:hypothetical protein